MKKLVTHSGGFHTDDALAYAILQLHFEKTGEAYEIVRSRDSAVIKTGDIVFDVGGEYNLETNRYDHHQEGRAGLRENGIPYASSGLIWKHFGRNLCISDETYKRVDVALIQPVDSHDSGVDITQEIFPGVSEFTIGHVMDCYEPKDFPPSTESQDAAFKEASQFLKFVLLRSIENIQRRIDQQNQVLATYQQATDKSLIELQYNYGRGVWKVLSGYPDALYVLYPNSIGRWCVEGIKKPEGIFDVKKFLPKKWWGLKDQEFANVSGVADGLFCHPNGFIAGANTREGALELARLALTDKA